MNSATHSSLVAILCAVALFQVSNRASAVSNVMISCPAPTPAETAIYRDANDPANASHVALTEQYHFTPEVEQLIRGSSAKMPMDIDFTLRHHPNHYRALWAMARWQRTNRIPTEFVGRALPIDCYFERAFAFRPEDPQLRVLYAMNLHALGRLSEAEVEYGKAERLGAATAEYYYSRGLLELDLGHVAKAQEYADKAYALGYPLPGLKNKLAKARSGK